MKNASGSLLLLLTALIWGTAFVAQRFGMNFVGPLTFQAVRTLLGCAALLPVALARKKRLGAAFRMPSLRAVLTCGLLLGTAGTLQQIGLTTVPAGKAGFITALYVVLVPVFGMLVGRRTGARTWIGVALSVVGLYLLSSIGSLTVAPGELLLIGCAVMFSLQILAIDHFAPSCDGVMLSCLQFLVAGLAPLPLGLILEHPQWSQLWDARLAIFYTGVFSCSIAYTLQILGQRRTPPALASLIMSLESVFSVIFGVLLLHESMTARELAGCALMLGAVILSQLPEKRTA